MKKFWKDWKILSKREISAIKSLNYARKIILREIPNNKIIAIYVGGSLIRREMNYQSDVDTWTIVKDKKTLKRFDELDKKYRNSCKPPVSLSARSVLDLKKGKSRISKLEHLILIYGKPIDQNLPKKPETKADLKRRIEIFYGMFLPDYVNKIFSFSQLVNQVFWLVELEQSVKGKNPPTYSWKKLALSIKDKNHIIHFAIKFRKRKIKDPRSRARFIKRLRMYLRKLEYYVNTNKMAYYIIIRGPLGCGKSTISEKLSKKLGAKHFSIDRELDKFTTELENGYISQKSFFKANEVIVPKAKSILKLNKPVIFDGNFYWKSQIDDLISKLDYPHYVFTLKAPLKLCIERDFKRQKPHGKDAAEAVYKKSTEFSYGKIINATKNIDKCVEDILSYLPKP